MILTEIRGDPRKSIVVLPFDLDDLFFVFSVPVDTKLEVVLSEVERPLKLATFSNTCKLLYHLSLDRNGEQLSAQIFLDCNRRLNSVDERLVCCLPKASDSKY